MDTARIDDRTAREALLWATDPDICAVQREEDMARETAFIDQIIEDVDRELAAEAKTAATPRLRPFTDVERARRSQRRAVREVLAEAHWLVGGTSGQGKGTGVAALLASAEFEGEAA